MGGAGASGGSCTPDVEVQSMLLFHRRLPPSVWFEACFGALGTLRLVLTLRTMFLGAGFAPCSRCVGWGGWTGWIVD